MRKLTESQIRNAPTVNCYVCDNVVFEDQAEYAPQDEEQVKPYCPKCIEEHPFLVDPMNGETEDSPTTQPQPNTARLTTTAQEKRLTAISRTLAEMGARGLGIYSGPNRSELKMYAVRGVVLIVQVFADGDGYEVYAPIVKSNSITATMDAIRAL